MIIERAKGSGMSDGLRYAFNQNVGEDNDNHPRDVKTPTGLNPEDESKDPEKAFTSSNTNGNLYNTENDKPLMAEGQTPPLTEPGSNRRVDSKRLAEKRLNRVKLGDHVSYSFGEGTVVARENMMVKIANDDTEHIDTVPIGETYFKDDIISAGNIMTQMWDLMAQQQRSSVLTKANIVGELQKAYLYRDWDDIPNDVQGVIKEQNYYDGPPHGGVAGREPDFSGRNEESRSHRDVTQPEHVTRPYNDPKAPAHKSDVEHGAYGGIVTDTNIDATDEYEDDRPSKPLSGAQEISSQGPDGIIGDGKTTPKREPEDPKSKPTDSKWNEEHKADQDLASVTGEGEKTKDTDTGVMPESQGFQGAKPNAQSAEKTEQDLASITGEGEKTKEDGGLSTGTSGTTNPVYGDGPTRKKSIINKHNSRWGPRQASEEDIKRLLEDNS